MSADPHAFRGAHPTEGGVVIRAVRPAAKQITVFVDNKEVGELTPADTDGLFEGVIKGAKLPLAVWSAAGPVDPGSPERLRDW